MNLKHLVFQATGKAAAQERWTEARLVKHMQKRKADQPEIDIAIAAYKAAMS